MPGRPFGTYELEGRLAVGGMAEVFVARAPGGGRLAIKALHASLCRDRETVAMFEQEAALAARLDHPGICRVIDSGAVDGRRYLAMELLDGADLGAAAPHLDARAIAGLTLQALDALAHAHGRGIVHRDVTPSNLFVRRDGRLMVLDFGIAKVADAAARTGPGVLKGKLPYMAPEYLLGHTLDGRADLFSLGAVLHEALTGVRLFARPTRRATVRAITEEPLAEAAGVAPALAAVIRRALARPVGERWPDCGAMAVALRAALAELGGEPAPGAVAAAVADLHITIEPIDDVTDVVVFPDLP